MILAIFTLAFHHIFSISLSRLHSQKHMHSAPGQIIVRNENIPIGGVQSTSNNICGAFDALQFTNRMVVRFASISFPFYCYIWELQKCIFAFISIDVSINNFISWYFRFLLRSIDCIVWRCGPIRCAIAASEGGKLVLWERERAEDTDDTTWIV